MDSPLETCVQLVRDCGLATGHADSYTELLREVLEQHEVARVRIAELEEALDGRRGLHERAKERIAELEAERAEMVELLRPIAEPITPILELDRIHHEARALLARLEE